MNPPEHDGIPQSPSSPDDESKIQPASPSPEKSVGRPRFPERTPHVTPRQDQPTAPEEKKVTRKGNLPPSEYPPFLASRLPQATPLAESELAEAPPAPLLNPVLQEIAEFEAPPPERPPQVRLSPERRLQQIVAEALRTPQPVAEDEEGLEPLPMVQYDADPIFAFLVIIAITSIGLAPVEAHIRYVIAWSLLGAAGALGYLLGSVPRLSDTSLDDLTAGLGFGLLIGVPLLILFGTPLALVSERMFDMRAVPGSVMDTWAFMAVIFVIPIADTLFFRGAMQEVRSLLLTGALATLWWILLFFPHLEIGSAYGVGLSIAVLFALLNFFYSYMRYRNGLAAAWICQIVSSAFLWFLPRLLF